MRFGGLARQTRRRMGRAAKKNIRTETVFRAVVRAATRRESSSRAVATAGASNGGGSTAAAVPIGCVGFGIPARTPALLASAATT